MRVLLITAFLFKLIPVPAQDDGIRYYSLDEAIHTAIINHPEELTAPGKKKLTCDIKSAWYNWLYSIHKFHVIHEYHGAVDDLNRIIILRYHAGDEGLNETSARLGFVAGLETSAAVAFNDIEINKNLISRYLYTFEKILPSDTSLVLYEIDKSFKYGPEIRTTGDSIRDRYNEFMHASEMENRQLRLDNLFLRLEYYRSYGLKQAETAIHTANAEYRNEEIDFIQFADKIAVAYQLRLDYLDILNEYNQNAIQLEYYAY